MFLQILLKFSVCIVSITCYEINDQIYLPISKIFPAILNVTENGIFECFDETINKVKIPLFVKNSTGIDIITKYYSALPDQISNPDSISNLFKSLDHIITYVLNCSLNIQKHSGKPLGSYTKVGLTSLSDMNEKDLQKLTSSEKDFNKVFTFGRSLNDDFLGNILKKTTTIKFSSSLHRAPSFVSPSGKGLGNCKLLNRTEPIPKTWDWRMFGVVTNVRQQYTCGACWAVITAQAVESALLKAGKARRWGAHLSVQQILDYDERAFGCEGGSAPTSFSYVHKAGLTAESIYPYQNRQNSRLTRKKQFPVLARISNYCVRGRIHMPVYARDYLTDEDIERELVAHGPLYALIHGEGHLLQNYKSGIIDDEACSKITNHACLIVGYDEEAFILQNSWGRYWGENGYFRVAKGKNVCGYLTEIAYALP